MREILFALLSAFFFAAHSVAVRGGLKGSNPMTATLVSSISNTVLLWVVAVLFLPFSVFLNKGLIYLGIAGFLAPCLARVFMYTGIEKVGVSITASIKETAQFFAAALLYGVSRYFRRLGMITVTSAWGGATVMASISLLLFPLILWTLLTNRRLAIDKKGFFFFALGGLMGGFGQVFALAAFKLGDVVVVGPLISTAPFFSILLTFVFLKKLERLTMNVILGAVLIVAAVVILTVFS